MRALSPFISERLLAVTFLAAIFTTLSFAQESPKQRQTPLPAPRPLIVNPIDESRLTVLKGNTHPLARSEFDLGTAPATLPMRRMLLVLKRSPEQESSLAKLL